MFIYLISQHKNVCYDTYDSAVVIANSEDDARKIHPSRMFHIDEQWWNDNASMRTWTHIDNIKVKLIGTANDDARECVVLASFQAK